jgi:hypothetical protein
MMMMMDTSKKTNGSNASGSMPMGVQNNNNSSFAGKKVMPNTYKNPKKLYVSPYSQKMK